MNEGLLAIRNLLRNRRRSISTVAALAIGLASILLFAGFRANLTFTGITDYARAGGHLQIQHRDYFLYGSGNPTAYAIADYDELLDAIRKDPELAKMVDVATPMLRFGGLAGNFDAGISRTVIGTGYAAEDVNRMRQWNEYEIPVVQPSFPLEGTGPDSAIVGIGVARVLQLCAPLHIEDCPSPEQSARSSTQSPAPGKKAVDLPTDIAALAETEHAGTAPAARKSGARIELLSSTSGGAPNVATLNVVAAEDQGFKELDEVSVIVHLAQAQKLVFGREKPRVTAIMILLNRSEDEAAAKARLETLVQAHTTPDQPLVVRGFGELNPFYVQSEKMFDVIFNFIFALIGGIVLFTVGNTMNTAVVERTVEIGTLRAVGLRRAGIRRLFILEGLVLGCVGAIVGIVAALGLAALVNHSGLTWLPPGVSQRLPLQLRVLGDMNKVMGTSISLMLIAAASAWLPAWRAANLKVVEALRHA